ncbi:MAG: LUD domain-containing protein, partial [Candidatus Glassbacteria bacterium]|nr:LUD domain-containing protein [Candidatus Glassbacteria bacterium]
VALGDKFLRQAMDSFAVSYRQSRAGVFEGFDLEVLTAEIASARDEAVSRLDELFQRFRQQAEAAGARVYLAADADEANRIIARIARDCGAKKIIKSKSMTAEETFLNRHLEGQGFEVTETDLGEWIIQLRREGPSHMVMPAIHLSRGQVAELFSAATGKTQEADIGKLVRVARQQLRHKFLEADLGISGANFAVAGTGTLGIVSNEGNARLATTLPAVHVALVGLEKLTPSLHDALLVLKALPRNATGQANASYVTWITGRNECLAARDGKKELHIVFLDNGRRAMAADPVFSQALRCARCGACANVCPVYRLVGGHRLGHVYIGAIGLVLTYFYHGRDKAGNLVQNCLNCGACKEVCMAGIDLPGLIAEVRARILDEAGHPAAGALLAGVLKNRRLFHGLLRLGRRAQKPAVSSGYLRHLPLVFSGEQDFRALPAIAEVPFRDLWEEIRPEAPDPRLRVALFAGCLQDFVYPEQLTAVVRLAAGRGVALEFPPDQTCCGLPLQMTGEKRAAREVAAQNVAAIDPSRYDYILTACASCASHLKHWYPKLLAGSPEMSGKAAAFADKVIDFSSFILEVIKPDPAVFGGPAKKTAYHAPCHLCRGLGVAAAPRDLLAACGLDYCRAAEEDVCCGFGGTFSLKFPELSAELLDRKLDSLTGTGAEQIVTDCPGCVMQLRGGAYRRGLQTEVKHLAEALAERLR